MKDIVDRDLSLSLRLKGLLKLVREELRLRDIEEDYVTESQSTNIGY